MNDQAVFTDVNSSTKREVHDATQGQHCGCCTTSQGNAMTIVGTPVMTQEESDKELLEYETLRGPLKKAASAVSMPQPKTLLMIAVAAVAIYVVYTYVIAPSLQKSPDTGMTETFTNMVSGAPAPSAPSAALNTVVGAATTNMSLGVSNLFQDV